MGAGEVAAERETGREGRNDRWPMEGGGEQLRRIGFAGVGCSEGICRRRKRGGMNSILIAL